MQGGKREARFILNHMTEPRRRQLLPGFVRQNVTFIDELEKDLATGRRDAASARDLIARNVGMLSVLAEYGRTPSRAVRSAGFPRVSRRVVSGRRTRSTGIPRASPSRALLAAGFPRTSPAAALVAAGFPRVSPAAAASRSPVALRQKSAGSWSAVRGEILPPRPRKRRRPKTGKRRSRRT